MSQVQVLLSQLHSPTVEKFITKGMFIIVLISRSEKDYLIAHGVREGSNGISHTIPKGKKRTYYLCESNYNMRKLEEYRAKTIVK